MRPPFILADVAAAGLRLLDPEKAHRLAVRLAATNLSPKLRHAPDPRLAIELADLAFLNPLGLAAGFDKNAEAVDALLDLGFGFVEIGAVTPRPQAGNPRPRVFRLKKDLAVINRYGFNNDGLEAVAARLGARAKRGVVGANLGANKDSADRIEDFASGVRALGDLVDFCTINISSPNTPGLRALQGRAELDDLLSRVMAARGSLTAKPRIFLKVAPDLADADKADIAASALSHGVDALIVANTTLARPAGLVGRARVETGGLSGAPLFEASTALLREFRAATAGRMPLIGVGGVFSARDVYRKILAGASLVQLYTALIYSGPGLVARILRELPDYLDADGFDSIARAVGAENCA